MRKVFGNRRHLDNASRMAFRTHCRVLAKQMHLLSLWRSVVDCNSSCLIVPNKLAPHLRVMPFSSKTSFRLYTPDEIGHSEGKVTDV